MRKTMLADAYLTVKSGFSTPKRSPGDNPRTTVLLQRPIVWTDGLVERGTALFGSCRLALLIIDRNTALTAGQNWMTIEERPLAGGMTRFTTKRDDV